MSPSEMAPGERAAHDAILALCRGSGRDWLMRDGLNLRHKLPAEFCRVFSLRTDSVVAMGATWLDVAAVLKSRGAL